MDRDYEEEDENLGKVEEKSIFNVAVGTLEALLKILENIKDINTNPHYSPEARQNIKLILVKSFFTSASPLLGEEYVKKNKDKILKLRSASMPFAEKYSLNSQVKQRLVYDEELEVLLDSILIDIQLTLQKRGYFMPSSEDSSLY